MKTFIKVLLSLTLIALLLAFIVGWIWGVPLLAVWLFDANYWFSATIWLSIIFVRHTVKLALAKRDLKKYQDITEILGGKRNGN